MLKMNYLLGCLLSILSCSVLGTTSGNNIEFSIAGGFNWTHADNTHLVVSSQEIDKNQVNHVTSNPITKVGIGYYFVNRVLLELNLYHSSQTIRGNVWQYQMPEFNNYQFKAPLTSTRLMLDVKPRLFTWNQISPYVIIGIGATQNTMSYNETASASDIDANSALALDKKTNTTIAYDAGLGAKVAINDRFSIALEYLYTNLGNANPAGHSQNAVSLTSPPKFSLSSQAALLNFNWMF